MSKEIATHVPQGFAIPWPVRYRRAWWLREARYNIRAARRGTYRDWHLRMASEARSYARGVVVAWFERGVNPSVGPRSEAEAFPLPPHPGDWIS